MASNRPTKEASMKRCYRSLS